MCSRTGGACTAQGSGTPVPKQSYTPKTPSHSPRLTRKRHFSKKAPLEGLALRVFLDIADSTLLLTAPKHTLVLSPLCYDF